MVGSMVSFLGLQETAHFFLLMVLFSFIKYAFQLISILYKRSVSIDERNWPFGLRGSCLTHHGGFHGEFSLSPGNDVFFVLMVLFSFIRGVFKLLTILYTRPVSIDERNWPFVL
jgi:hypothetical protein